jgi:carbamoyl-phosphate synthase small subunit
MPHDDAPPAKLALEDGTVFTGRNFGSTGTAQGEVVFNTSMTGYQEILTDPSYKGQIVTMTYPLIGNYGINRTDVESRSPHVAGFVIKELSPVYSNWRADMSLDEYLKLSNVIGIQGIDTRALTRRLRIRGAMRGVLSTEILDDIKLVERAAAVPDMSGADWVKQVKPRDCYTWEQDQGEWKLTGEVARGDGLHVVALDCGAKQNILRHLIERGVKVTVLPPDAPASEILKHKPDGLFVSNGPGDPAAVDYAIRSLRDAMGQVPTFGICLGHQLLGLAMGRDDVQAQVRSSRRESAGEESRHRARGDHQPEPRLRRRPRVARAAGRDRHAHQPERRHGGGLPSQDAASLLGSVSPGSEPGSARRDVPVRRVHRDDEDEAGAVGKAPGRTSVPARIFKTDGVTASDLYGTGGCARARMRTTRAALPLRRR